MKVDLQGTDDISVQLAPLLDCVFLLLIFFLVATTLRSTTSELPLDLPVAAASAGARHDADLLVISIDHEGLFHLGVDPVDAGYLIDLLRHVAAENPARRIRIDTDRRAPSQALVQALEMCHFEGLSNIGIRTKRVPFGPEDFRYHE